jgi:hypothetical protein
MMSLDGAFVQVVGGDWKEVKTLAVGVVEKPKEEKGELVIHTRKLSYFSRMSDISRFEKQALVEVFERGVEKAGKVCAVTDGADWIQGFVDLHRADAVRILDMAHAKERISDVATAIAEQGLVLELLNKQEHPAEKGKDDAEKKRVQIAWVEGLAKELKTGDPDAVLEEMQQLRAALERRGISSGVEAISKSINYLQERRPMIEYAQFQALGYPIGSGCVESANKLVVEARMKGAGMRWGPEHVDPMLALRNVACNDRWTPSWKLIRKYQLSQLQAKRVARSVERLSQIKPPPAFSPVNGDTLQNEKTLPQEVAPSSQRQSTAKTPSSTHPWRRPFLRKRPAA